MERWEQQVRMIENMNSQAMEQQMQFYEYNKPFDYQMSDDGRPKQSLLGDLPPLKPTNSEPGNRFSSHAQQNNDLMMAEQPSAEGYNYSLVQMDDFLKDQGLYEQDSTNLVNNYYANLSLMGYNKPCYFPPPDLGMIESLGSFENTSKYPETVHSKKSHQEKSHTTSIISKHSKVSHEQHLSDLKSLNSSHDSTSGIKGGSPREIPSPPDTTSTKKTYIKSENPDLTEESYYILEDISKEGLQKFLKDAMMVFNEKYAVDRREMETDVEVMPPTYELVFQYCKYVVVAAKMEKEIPILALVYLERLISRTGVLMNELNWRRLMLVTLCIASKIWDDDSLENEHFPKVMKDVTIQEINTFERIFLDLIGYDLVIRGAEYAKYYFILRTIAKTNNIKMPLRPLTVEKVQKLHKSSNEAELNLREMNRKVTSVEHSM